MKYLIHDCDNTFGVPDCDVDDAMALLYLLGCPDEVKVLGVTCAYGNSTQDIVHNNTIRMLKEWGRSDIPVLRGADFSSASSGARQSEAAEFLAATAKEYENDLLVLATGSLSNLLGAAELDPDFFHRVKTFSLMGGVTGPLIVGNGHMNELNFSCDPDASLAVLTRPEHVMIATAQNSLESYFTRDECQKAFDANGTPLAKYLAAKLAYWFDYYEREWELAGFVNWDLMAAVQLIHPEFFDMNESVITPSLASLKTGILLGGGEPTRVFLPKISCREKYFAHTWQHFFATGINPKI